MKPFIIYFNQNLSCFVVNHGEADQPFMIRIMGTPEFTTRNQADAWLAEIERAVYHRFPGSRY